MSDIVEVRRRVAEHAAAGRGIFSVVGIKALLAELERLDRDLLAALNENARLREALKVAEYALSFSNYDSDQKALEVARAALAKEAGE